MDENEVPEPTTASDVLGFAFAMAVWLGVLYGAFQLAGYVRDLQYDVKVYRARAEIFEEAHTECFDAVQGLRLLDDAEAPTP